MSRALIFSSFSFLFFGFSFLPLAAFGYVASSRSLLAQAGLNGGQGGYEVLQEHLLVGDGEAVTLFESWAVQDALNLRIAVSSAKNSKDAIYIVFIYKDGKKYWLDENGEVKSEAIPHDSLDHLLFFRSRAGLSSALVEKKIAPAAIFKEREIHRSGDSFEYRPQSFIRLVQLSGIPTFLLSAVGTEADPTGVWINASDFTIAKIVAPSRAEFETEKYSEYPNELKLPSRRFIRWEGYTSQLKTVKATSLGLRWKGGDLFSPSSLRAVRSKLRWPEQTVSREFYNRFR